MAGIRRRSCTRSRAFSSFFLANSDMRLRKRWPRKLQMLNSARPKRPRLHLDIEQYNQLRQEILRRDGWRCQRCGTRSNLEVHHQEFRSHCGDDSEENLITLCASCHEQVHRNRQRSIEQFWFRKT